MKLRDVIAQYRAAHGLSMREFGRKCHFSNAYVSILESGVNPRTGAPLRPTIDTYKKLAAGMGISLTDLFDMLQDDELVLLSASGKDDNALFDQIKERPLLQQAVEIAADLSDKDLSDIIKIMLILDGRSE